MKQATVSVLGCTLASVFFGCGDQVDEAYRGERLLSVSAKVVGLAQGPTGDIEPILAYDDGARMHFQPVEYTGDFPPGFELSVYDAPPEEVLFRPLGLPGEPLVAFAYIGAVTPDHPDSARYPRLNEGWTRVSADPAAPLVSGTRHCDVNGECFETTTTCDADGSNCRMTQEGDPALSTSAAMWFRGLAFDTILVYLDGRAEEGSATATALGGPAPPGFHIVEARPFTQSERQANEDCILSAIRAAVSQYNAEHDAAVEWDGSYPADLDLYAQSPFLSEHHPVASTTGLPEPGQQPDPGEAERHAKNRAEELAADYGEIERLAMTELLSQGCELTSRKLVSLQAPSDRQIAFQLVSRLDHLGEQSPFIAFIN
ncbi:MAG: hypothetical protein OXR73_23845 [Myxococcales bacterium]|nr:hypothetical protein [Myxococcales bacterium]